LGGIDVARGKRALACARTLRYTSVYVLPTRGWRHRGYFDLGGGRSLRLPLVATGAVNNLAVSEWKDRELLDDDGLAGLFRGRHIWLPGDEVTPQLAAEALRRWCRERFESTRLPLDSPDGRAAIDRPRPGLDRKRGGGDMHVRAIRET